MPASLLTTDGAVASLAPEWLALWRSAPAATPFQSPLWLLPWWAQWGTGAPRVAVLRAPDDRLLGVLPLYVQREGTITKLLPFGVGITDYTDALLAPDAPDGACDLLLGSALAGAPVDVCDLPDLPPGAALWQSPPPPDWCATSWTGEPCPVVALPASMAVLLAGVSRGTRRYLQQAELRSARDAAVTLDRAAPDDAQAALTALFDLHALRWEGRGEAGVLADPRVQAFHRAAAPGLIAHDALRLEVLRLDGKPAAAHLSFLAPDRLLHYVTGFDPALEWARPGALLLGRLMADAIAEGRRELHFLRGNEAYKYAWGGVDRFNMGRHLTKQEPA